MREPLSPSDLAERILSGEAPERVRLAAARGALPLPRAVLVEIWLHLQSDPSEAVRTQARTALDSLGDTELEAVLAEPECSTAVLAYLASRAARDESLAEKVAFHPAADEAVLVPLAERGSPGIIELLLTNQERLRRSPKLLDRLLRNPALRPDQRGRLMDFLSRIGSPAEASDDTEDSRGEDPEASEAPVDAEDVARLLDVDVGELISASEIQGAEELASSEDPEVRSAFQKIAMLNTAQKAILAMKGGREERMILVRDTNKLVALSVLRNPRLSDQEVEGIARMRNVNDEVLRAVGTHREWVKHYGVVAALVRNPRTPPGIATNFVNRLSTQDLKLLARDKNVPEVIRRMAKRMYETRTQRTAGKIKKGRR